MLPKPTSFISEHSAEFYLLPRLIRSLSGFGFRSIPFYFSSTREGSKIARAFEKGDRFSVVAMFARRPKLRTHFDTTILVKLNEQLFINALCLGQAGIPVIAGAPVARSIFDLNVEGCVAWFNLPTTIEPRDIEIELALDGTPLQDPQGLLLQEGGLSQIAESASPMTYSEAVAAIRKARREASQQFDLPRLWYLGSNYKPVFLLLDRYR